MEENKSGFKIGSSMVSKLVNNPFKQISIVFKTGLSKLPR